MVLICHVISQDHVMKGYMWDGIRTIVPEESCDYDKLRLWLGFELGLDLVLELGGGQFSSEEVV